MTTETHVAAELGGQTALATPLRFVTVASLFDGHDAAINVMRRLIQDSGAEVVHLGHNRSVSDVVRAAIQEDVDAIGLSILFTWLWLRSGRSLLVVILFHAAVNLGSWLPGALGAVGPVPTFYALATWIAAIGVARSLRSPARATTRAALAG